MNKLILTGIAIIAVIFVAVFSPIFIVHASCSGSYVSGSYESSCDGTDNDGDGVIDEGCYSCQADEYFTTSSGDTYCFDFRRAHGISGGQSNCGQEGGVLASYAGTTQSSVSQVISTYASVSSRQPVYEPSFTVGKGLIVADLCTALTGAFGKNNSAIFFDTGDGGIKCSNSNLMLHDGSSNGRGRLNDGGAGGAVCKITSCPTTPATAPTVSCSASPSSINTGNSTTFTATASGGTGSYTYLWTGDCSGTGSTCTSAYSTTGTKTATVVATASGVSSPSATCTVSVSQTSTCTPNSYQRCIGNSNYWYNSCGDQGDYIGSCGNYCTANSYQRCVGNTNYWYDSCGNQGSYIGSCGNTCSANAYQRCLGNNLYWYDSCGNLGSLIQYCQNGCTNNSCSNYNYGYLNVSKTVRNLTNGNSFATTTYASPSDMLMFMITLQNTANTDISNVFVRDTLPANLIYNNQLVVACSGGSNCSNYNYNNYSGSIASGISLNTINANQTVTITYQVQVAPPASFVYGTTTLNNSVYVTGTNMTNTPVSTASVVVTKSGVLGASTISTGLTNNFWVDSFILPLILTLIGIWMLKSGMFFGIERWLDSKKRVRHAYRADKEFATRIEKLQKTAR